MDIQKAREAFERRQAKVLNTPYKELKARFDENFRLFGARYNIGSINEKEWNLWLEAWQAKAQAVPIIFENDCMISQTWFMKGSPVSALIKHAEDVYKAEAIAQNSKIKFGTDDNKHWFAHDVPFFGRVQIDRIEEHGLVEWDIFFNECWQGPFNTKSKCIRHLEECIKEMHEEAQEQGND